MPDAPTSPVADAAPAAPAASAEPTVAAPSQPDGGERPKSLFERLFHRAPKPETDPASASPKADAPRDEKPATPETLTLTQEELDRKVQAETDRREARRRREERDAEKKRLRREDPYAYAELEEQEEAQQHQQQSVTTLMASTAQVLDGYTTDVIRDALPEADRARILGEVGNLPPLEGRAHVVREGLKALEKHWKAQGAREAEARLRKNPAFGKQLLAEVRGEQEEPDLVAGRNGGGTPSMNDWMRQALPSKRR